MSAPDQLARLRARIAETCDLHALGALMMWDQNTMMPPGGAEPRGDMAATLMRVIHERETDPEIARLLDALEPWADGEDPDSDDARLVLWTRRDYEKSVRVPTDLAAEMSRARSLGLQAWQEALAANDYKRFEPALAHQIELRHRYVECFENHDHPYDVLLDDFEPGLRTAELRPLLGELRDALVPLVAATGDREQARNDGVFAGPFSVEAQRAAVTSILESVGFDPDTWRLDPSIHPFAQSLATTDVRITTKYDEHDFAVALYSVLHEFGHGLYEASIDPRLARTTLGEPVSLGVHESQSRMWENIVGRSRPFATWLLPRLRELFPGSFRDLEAGDLYRAVNTVQPSLIRIEADETTYNLHIVLRFELELALMEGTLDVAGLPEAWNDGMERLLGLEVPSDAEGVLQDTHWGSGLIGYFPTYTIGNLMSAQLWQRIEADLDGLEEQLATGEFGPLREWLRLHVHRHGRKLFPRELLRRVTGEELQVEPFLAYLRAKLADAGLLAPA
ncbi:MAG: carboxypeptidase Taq [Solirubrobacteraceae bacterium]|nr:carboxypeptidase Taq [Solirubrobacteraceae bacterium]